MGQEFVRSRHYWLRKASPVSFPAMAIDLSGRTIIITGASSGIGEATAVECARHGMNVVLNARRADRLEEVARQVQDRGARALAVVGDVADADMSRRLLNAAADEFGGFYSVFANAGYGLERAVTDCSMDDLRRIFEVNFFAAFELIQVAAQQLLDNKQPGHLLMCSSCVARFTIPYYSAYSATKAAQAHVCAAMRAELKRDNIYVSSVMPIGTETEFHQAVMRHNDRDVAKDKLPDHSVSMFVQPADRVAKAVVKCLRNPKPEVWTSFIVRFAASLFTLSPRLAAFALDRQTQHKPSGGESPA